jgi:metal-responsive CopG/Arc/MetJ family transcriptional regulator
MITKAKTSVSLSVSLLSELAAFSKNGNVSDFIEKALSYYITALKKQERVRRDIQIINANAPRFNREAEENLLYQADL